MFAATAAWLRRHVGWSNSRRAWQERISFVLLAGGAAALWAFHKDLSGILVTILTLALILATAVLLRRGWLKLFGPVLFYDLVTTARRTRYMLLRWGYVLLMSLMLVWLFGIWNLGHDSGRFRTNEMANFAATFFYMFMTVQFLTIALLTPAYTAGAIAQEKEAKTLEFLLATDLSNREIVLGKLVARICNLMLIILAGLPILSFLQFLGGIDPELLLQGFAATGMTLISLASLSILMSVSVRRSRDAIMLTYLAGLLYLGVSILLNYTLQQFSSPGNFMAGWGVHMHLGKGWKIDVTPSDVGECLVSGNILVAMFTLGTSGSVSTVLPSIAQGYLIFHALVALGCATLAVVRVRPIALKETYGFVKRRATILRGSRLPLIGSNPMFWKELVAEPALRVPWLIRLGFLAVIVLTFTPVIDILGPHLGDLMHGWISADSWEMLGREMNVYVRVVGTLVLLLMLVLVAVRAATAITGERARQTLDALLTTPMSAEAILLPKLVGAVFSVRWLWLWPGTIYFLGLVTGGVSILALPLLTGAWLVYAFFFALLGLWFSVIKRTSLRATLWTIGTGLGVGVGHWLLMGMCCYLPIGMAGSSGPGTGDLLEFLAKVHAGQTPPFVLGWLALRGDEFNHRPYGDDSPTHLTLSCFFGLFCWSLVALGVWHATRNRFRQMTFRMPRIQPERRVRRLPDKKLSPPSEGITRRPAASSAPPDQEEEILDAFPEDRDPLKDT